MRRFNKSTTVRAITVKFDGKCACCGAPIKAGELAEYWPKEKKIAHLKAAEGNSTACASNLGRERESREQAAVAAYVAEGLGES